MRLPLFLDLGPGEANFFQEQTWWGPHETWQDHGLGLLATIAKREGYPIQTAALGTMPSWAYFRMFVKQFDLLLMNVRSWRYPVAVKAARIAKSANPKIQVAVGGFHATVAPEEMLDVPEFDHVCSGPGESLIVSLLEGAPDLGRMLQGERDVPGHLDGLPFIDRELWPRLPHFPSKRADGTASNVDPWPLESYVGWGPGPRVATLYTARACPFHCAFCSPAERNHFGTHQRRSVDSTLAELGYMDLKWGPIDSVVYHDAEFFANRRWLTEYLARYPKETPSSDGRGWPYWAAGRADLMLKWADLFEALLKETAWTDVSIGLESGSQRSLDIMEKGTTVEQNEGVIDLVNRIGDELEAKGRPAPRIFANLMVAVPGEEPEDAFATFRMAKRIKRSIPSFAWFTPYPGSKLGDKLRRENLVIDQAKRIYDRTPGRDRVVGVDYEFYRGLWAGKYDREVGFSVPEFLMEQGKR